MNNPKSMTNENHPRYVGYRARFAGPDSGKPPFPPGSWEHDQWMIGWLENDAIYAREAALREKKRREFPDQRSYEG